MTTKQTEIRNEKVTALNVLIQATRDSAQFYSDAAKAVDNPALRTLFDHMADSKNGLVGSMSNQVQTEGGEPAKSGTLRGALSELYGAVRAQISIDKRDFTYVSQLEKGEDRLMAAFHDVIKSDSAPKEVKDSLLSYLPTVKAHHDTLRDRKRAMEANQSRH